MILSDEYIWHHVFGIVSLAFKQFITHVHNSENVSNFQISKLIFGFFFNLLKHNEHMLTVFVNHGSV